MLVDGGKLPSEEIAANPAYTPPDSIEAREGCGPDELSGGFGQTERGRPGEAPAAAIWYVRYQLFSRKSSMFQPSLVWALYSSV